MQLNESEFLHKQLTYVEHFIISNSVKLQLDKIRAIKNFPIPKQSDK